MALLSYSSCTVYNECPQRYKWSRIDHRPPLSGREDITATVPGTIAHNAAEDSLVRGNAQDFSAFDTPNLEATAREFNSRPDVSFEDRWGSFDAGMDYIKQCAGNLCMFLNGENLKEKNYLSEWWFGDVKNPLPLSRTCLLQGACDLIVFYDGPKTAVIYDYKATKTDRWLHPEQLITYALAAKMRTGYDVHMAFFYLMPVQRQVCVPIGPGDLEAVKNMYITASDRIDAGAFKATPSKQSCRFCEYYPCPNAKASHVVF